MCPEGDLSYHQSAHMLKFNACGDLQIEILEQQ